MDRSNTPPHHAPQVPHGHHGHLAADGVQQRRWLVLLAMTGSLAMIFVDMTVVGVALPRMGSALSMSDVDQAWIITSYLITLASLMALGWPHRRFDRQSSHVYCGGHRFRARKHRVCFCTRWNTTYCWTNIARSCGVLDAASIGRTCHWRICTG